MTTYKGHTANGTELLESTGRRKLARARCERARR